MCKVIECMIDDKKVHIADIKEMHIRNIADAAKKCPDIEKVVIFGSSITDRCREDSDIDVALFGKKDRARFWNLARYRKFAEQLYRFDGFMQSYDILYFKMNSKDNSFILQEVNRGEVIYEKADN